MIFVCVSRDLCYGTHGKEANIAVHREGVVPVSREGCKIGRRPDGIGLKWPQDAAVPFNETLSKSLTNPTTDNSPETAKKMGMYRRPGPL